MCIEPRLALGYFDIAPPALNPERRSYKWRNSDARARAPAPGEALAPPGALTKAQQRTLFASITRASQATPLQRIEAQQNHNPSDVVRQSPERSPPSQNQCA